MAVIGYFIAKYIIEPSPIGGIVASVLSPISSIIAGLMSGITGGTV